MFGPVISRIDAASSAPATRVVGHERPFRLEDVEHRMPAVDDLAAPARRRSPAGSSSAAGPARPAPPARRAGPARPPWPASAGAAAATAVAQLQEQLVFQLLRLLVGREHLLFVFLQLRRDVALGVLDRLLADVVGGDLVAVGVGDLDVVAEDLVEADLEVGDAGPLDLLGLVAGDPLLAAVGQLAQRVESALKPSRMKPPSRLDSGQSSTKRRVELAAQLGAEVELALPARFSSGLRAGRELGLQRRQTAAACGRGSSGRAGWPGRSSRGPAAARRRTRRAAVRADSAASAGVGDQFLDRVVPRVDRGDVGQRIGQPVGQQPRAHRRDRAIEHGQQRAFAAAVADRARDFQAAAAGLVDLQRLARCDRASAGRCAPASSSAFR